MKLVVRHFFSGSKIHGSRDSTSGQHLLWQMAVDNITQSYTLAKLNQMLELFLFYF